MTVPIERTNAVIHTERFLLDLINPKATPRIPKAIREQAGHLLRHYPSQYDMGTIADREDGKEAFKAHKVFGRSFM